MAQMCGATAIKYYLPTVFLALGLSKDLSLMASGIESTLKIGCTIIEMLIIDKLGRKKTLLLGSVIMAVAMIVCLKSSHSNPFDSSREVNGTSMLMFLVYRLTEPYHWHTHTTKINPLIMLVLCSSSSSLSAIPSDSDPTHGFMAPR
jgi:MFS family permease